MTTYHKLAELNQCYFEAISRCEAEIDRKCCGSQHPTTALQHRKSILLWLIDRNLDEMERLEGSPLFYKAPVVYVSKVLDSLKKMVKNLAAGDPSRSVGYISEMTGLREEQVKAIIMGCDIPEPPMPKPTSKEQVIIDMRVQNPDWTNRKIANALFVADSTVSKAVHKYLHHFPKLSISA
jgi:hypothetical protein